ncbi:MAG: hypothetical protein OXU86_00080 [Thaumarchaeota archaeon]|nr:hypothetical protein [Nitrososphaerota archaeon]RNJ73222.1 MAG: hypothetical protein EB833_03185 [Thaumarchaeota archaeon S13]RNJ76624.1 MAG: hypothetical protein EB824_00465 [Thaumarchaeota archaeon S15]MDD9812691.1 hypothetical protein [Nitrososphaerota archaeon]MDD9825170.1 hypothetical protein [Nitrososphaerota archaeon]
MGKALEAVGFALIAGTVYAYLGLIAQKDPAGWPVFWACALGALGIIMYRKWSRRGPGQGPAAPQGPPGGEHR